MDNSCLSTKDLKFEEVELFQPKLEELSLGQYRKAKKFNNNQQLINIRIAVVKDGLKNNFREVSVEVSYCANLNQAPYFLASEGLTGNACLIDIGGESNLLPLPDKTRVYDLNSICHRIYGKINGVNEHLLIGAGIGPFSSFNTCIEGVYNFKSKFGGGLINRSRAVRTDENKERVLELFPQNETRCAFFSQLYLSEGKFGKCIKIKCKNRIGNGDFITLIRETLGRHYKDKTIGKYLFI